MLAKKNRLNLTKEENAQLFKRGESDFYSTQNLLFYFQKSDNLKMAAVAPKRRFQNAVSRVQAKRLLYNLFLDLTRENSLELEGLNFKLIVVYRKNDATKKSLKQDFSSALKHYEII